MDWLGVLLNAGIYASWVIAITFGGALWAWSDGRTIATFVVCGVLIIAMALQQYFAILTTKERRIFPGEFLKRRSVMLLYFAMNAATGTAFIAIYFVPIYFQFVKGDDGLDSAVRLLPIVITFVFSIFLNGALMPLVGYYMPVRFIILLLWKTSTNSPTSGTLQAEFS
jgi:MFS family permease